MRKAYSLDSDTNDKKSKTPPADISAILNHRGIAPVGTRAPAVNAGIAATVNPVLNFIIFPYCNIREIDQYFMLDQSFLIRQITRQ